MPASWVLPLLKWSLVELPDGTHAWIENFILEEFPNPNEHDGDNGGPEDDTQGEGDGGKGHNQDCESHESGSDREESDGDHSVFDAANEDEHSLGQYQVYCYYSSDEGGGGWGDY